MKVVISGVCGFSGSHLARFLLESHEGISVVGIDNLARNTATLRTNICLRTLRGDNPQHDAVDLMVLTISDHLRLNRRCRLNAGVERRDFTHAFGGRK